MVTDIKQIFGNTQELREALYGGVGIDDLIHPIDTDAVMYYNNPKAADGAIVRAKNFMVVFSPCEKFEDNIEPLKCPFVDGLETYNVTEGDHTNISFAQSFFDFIDGSQLTDNSIHTTTTWNVNDTDFLFVRDRKGAWYTNYLETIPNNETYAHTSRTLEQFVEEVIITEIEHYTELGGDEKRQFLLFGSHEGGGYGACRSMVHIGKKLKADKANSNSPNLYKDYAGIFSFTIFAYNFQTDILFQDLLKSTPIPGEYTEDIFPNLSVLPNEENQIDRTDDNISEELVNLYNLGNQIEDILTDPTIPITMKVGGGHLFEELDGLGNVGGNNLETPEDYNLHFLYNSNQYTNGLGRQDPATGEIEWLRGVEYIDNLKNNILKEIAETLETPVPVEYVTFYGKGLDGYIANANVKVYAYDERTKIEPTKLDMRLYEFENYYTIGKYEYGEQTSTGEDGSFAIRLLKTDIPRVLKIELSGGGVELNDIKKETRDKLSNIILDETDKFEIILDKPLSSDEKDTEIFVTPLSTLKSRLMDEYIYYPFSEQLDDDEGTLSSETDALLRWHNNSNLVANKLLKHKFGLNDGQLKSVDYIANQDVELLKFNIKLNSYKEIIKYILNGILKTDEYDYSVRDDLQVYFGIAGTILNYAEMPNSYQSVGTDFSHDKTGDDYLLDENVIEHILLATDKLCGDPFNGCRSRDITRKYHKTLDKSNVWYWYHEGDKDKSKIDFSKLATIVRQIATPIFNNINTLTNIATGSRTGEVSASNKISKDFVKVAGKVASIQKILEDYLIKTFVRTDLDNPSNATEGWWALDSDTESEIENALAEIQDDFTDTGAEIYSLVFGPPAKPSDIILSTDHNYDPYLPTFEIVNPSVANEEQDVFHKYEYKFSTFNFGEQRMVWICDKTSTESENVTPPEIPSDLSIDSDVNNSGSRKPAKIFSVEPRSVGQQMSIQYGHNESLAKFYKLASLDGESNVIGVYVRRVLKNGLRSEWCVSHPKLYFSPPHRFRDTSKGYANVSFTTESSYVILGNDTIDITWEYNQSETDKLNIPIYKWKLDFYWKQTEAEEYPTSPTRELTFFNYNVLRNESTSTLKKFGTVLDLKQYFKAGYYKIKLGAVDTLRDDQLPFESNSEYNTRVESGLYTDIAETNFDVSLTNFVSNFDSGSEVGFSPTFSFRNNDINEKTEASVHLPWPNPISSEMGQVNFVFDVKRWESSLDANTSIDVLNGNEIESVSDNGSWKTITAGYMRNTNATDQSNKYIPVTKHIVNLDDLYEQLQREHPNDTSNSNFIGYLETSFDTQPITDLIKELRSNADNENNQRLHYFRIRVRLEGETKDSQWEVSSPLIYDLRKLKTPTIESYDILDEAPGKLSLKLGNLPALLKTSGDNSGWGLDEYDSANINPSYPYGIFGDSVNRISTNQTTSFELSVNGGDFAKVKISNKGIIQYPNPISFEKRTISLRTVSSNSAILPSDGYEFELGFVFKKITFTKLATYSDKNHVYPFDRDTNTAEVNTEETNLYLEWENFGSNLPNLFGGIQVNGLEKLGLSYKYKVKVGNAESFILENNYFDISDYIKENSITISGDEAMEINVVALDESNQESLSEDFKINWKSLVNTDVQVEFASGLVRDTLPNKTNLPLVEWEWHFKDEENYNNLSPKIRYYELTLNDEPVKNEITGIDTSSKFKSELTITKELDYFEKGIRNIFSETFDSEGDYTLGVTAVLASGQKSQEFTHTISVNFETPKPPKSIELLNTEVSGKNIIRYNEPANIKFVETDESADREEIAYYEVKWGSNILEVDRDDNSYEESSASFTLSLDTDGLKTGGEINVISVIPISTEGIPGEGKQLQFGIWYTDAQLDDAGADRSITQYISTLGPAGMRGNVMRSNSVILPPSEITNDISELDSDNVKIGMAVSIKGTDVYTGDDYLLSARFNQSGSGWTSYQPIPLPSDCNLFHTQDSQKVIVSSSKFQDRNYTNEIRYKTTYKGRKLKQIVKKWFPAGVTHRVSRYSYENGHDYNLVVDNLDWKPRAEDGYSMYIFTEDSQKNVTKVFEKSSTQKQFNHDKPTGKYFELLGYTTMCSNEDGSLIAFGDSSVNGKLPSVQKYSIKINDIGLGWNSNARILKTESEPFNSNNDLKILKDYARTFRLDAYERDTIVTSLPPCGDGNERDTANSGKENINSGIAVKFSKFEKPSGEWKLFSYSNKFQEINVPEFDKNVQFAGNNIAMSRSGNKVAIGLLSTPDVENKVDEDFVEFDIKLANYSESNDTILTKHYDSPSSYSLTSGANLTRPIADVQFQWPHNQYVYYEVSYKKTCYSDWDIVWCDSAETELTKNPNTWHSKTTLPKLNEPKREYNKLMDDGSTVYANIYNANVEFSLKYNDYNQNIYFRVEGQKIEDDVDTNALFHPNDIRYNRQIRVTAYDKNGVSQTNIYGAYGNSEKVYAVLLDSYITPKKKILSHTPIIATIGVDTSTNSVDTEYKYINWGGHLTDEYNPSDYMESASKGGSFKRPDFESYNLSVESDSVDSQNVDYISAETAGRSPWVNSAAEFSAEKIVLSDDGSTMAVKLRPGLKRDNTNIMLVKVFKVDTLDHDNWVQLGQGFINNRFVNERGDVSLSGDGKTLALSKVTEDDASFTIFTLNEVENKWDETKTKERSIDVNAQDFSSAYKRSKYKLVESDNINHKFTHELVRLDAEIADNGYGSEIKLSYDGNSIVVSAPHGINSEIPDARTTGRIIVYENAGDNEWIPQVSPLSALEESVQDKIFKNISNKYKQAYGITFSDINAYDFEGEYSLRKTSLIEKSTGGEDNHYLGTNVFKIKGNLNFNTQQNVSIRNSGPKGPSTSWFYDDELGRTFEEIKNWPIAGETEIIVGDFIKTFSSVEVFNINDFRVSVVLPKLQIYKVVNTFDLVPLVGYSIDEKNNKSIKKDISDRYIAIEVIDNNSVAGTYLLNRESRGEYTWNLVRPGFASPDELPPHKIDEIYQSKNYPSKNYAIAYKTQNYLSLEWDTAYKRLSSKNLEKVVHEENPAYLVEMRESGNGTTWHEFPTDVTYIGNHWISSTNINGFDKSTYRDFSSNAENHFRITAKDDSTNTSEASDAKCFYKLDTDAVSPQVNITSIEIDDQENPIFSWNDVLDDAYNNAVATANDEYQLTWSNIGYILQLWKANDPNSESLDTDVDELIYTSDEISETSYKFPFAIEKNTYHIRIFVVGDTETNFYLDPERIMPETTKRRYILSDSFTTKTFKDIGYTINNPILRGWKITSATNDQDQNIEIHEEVSDYDYLDEPRDDPFDGTISNTAGTSWENSSWYFLPLKDDNQNNKKLEKFTIEIASYRKIDSRFSSGKFGIDFDYADLTEGDNETLAKIEIFKTDTQGENLSTPIFETDYISGFKTGEFVVNGHTFNVFANGHNGHSSLVSVATNLVNENTPSGVMQYKLVKKKFEIDLSAIGGLLPDKYNVRIKMHSPIDDSLSNVTEWNESNHRLYVLNKFSVNTNGDLSPSISGGYLDSTENVKIGEPITINWNDISPTTDSSYEPLIYKVTFNNSTLTDDLNDTRKTSKYKDDVKNKTNLKISRKSDQLFQYVIPADVYSITNTTNIKGTLTTYLYDMPLNSAEFNFTLFENKLDMFMYEEGGSGIEHKTGDTMKWAYYLDVKDTSHELVFDKYELELYRLKTRDLLLGPLAQRTKVGTTITRSVNATDGGVEALTASSPNNAYEFYDEFEYSLNGVSFDDFYTFELHITAYDKFGGTTRLIDGKSFAPTFTNPTLNLNNLGILSWSIPDVTARKTTSIVVKIMNGETEEHQEIISYDNKANDNTLEYALTTSGVPSGITYNVIVNLKYYDETITEDNVSWDATHDDLANVRNIRVKNTPTMFIPSQNNFFHDAEEDEMWSSTMVQNANGELEKVVWNERPEFICINPIPDKGNFVDEDNDAFYWTWDPVQGADGYKTEVKTFRLFQTWLTDTPNDPNDDWYATEQTNNPVEQTTGDPGLLYKYTSYYVEEVGEEDDEHLREISYKDEIMHKSDNQRELSQDFLDEYVTSSEAARPDINRKVGDWGILNSIYNESDEKLKSLVQRNHFLGFMHICLITPYTLDASEYVYGETQSSEPIMFSEFKPRVDISGIKQYITNEENLDLVFTVKNDSVFLPIELEDSKNDNVINPISNITITLTDATRANPTEHIVTIDSSTQTGELKLDNHDLIGTYTLKVVATSQFDTKFEQEINYEVVPNKGYFKDLPTKFNVGEYEDITVAQSQRPIADAKAPTIELPLDSFEHDEDAIASYLNKFADYDYTEQQIESYFSSVSEDSNVTYLPGDIIEFKIPQTPIGTNKSGTYTQNYINYEEYSVGYRKYIETNTKTITTTTNNRRRNNTNTYNNWYFHHRWWRYRWGYWYYNRAWTWRRRYHYVYSRGRWRYSYGYYRSWGRYYL